MNIKNRLSKLESMLRHDSTGIDDLTGIIPKGVG